MIESCLRQYHALEPVWHAKRLFPQLRDEHRDRFAAKRSFGFGIPVEKPLERAIVFFRKILEHAIERLLPQLICFYVFDHLEARIDAQLKRMFA